MGEETNGLTEVGMRAEFRGGETDEVLSCLAMEPRGCSSWS